MARVVIIGAGWLGLPLALHLQSQSHDVLVTKRDSEACQHLKTEHNLPAIKYCLGDEFPSSLQAADIYVINIAPGRRSIDKLQFVAEMRELFSACISERSHILFVSSTSVYGEKDQKITESTEPEPLTDSAQAHVELENWLRENHGNQSTILRLAGLVGEDRNPATHFAGKREITASHKVVNFVHRKDVITAISAILQREVWGKTLHLCARDHPTRMAYYKWAAKQLCLPEPHFFDESEQESCGKQISANETLDCLGMSLTYSSPYQMIPGAKPPYNLDDEINEQSKDDNA